MIFQLSPQLVYLNRKKIPSEMEVAPRYMLFTLLTLLTLFKIVYTVDTVTKIAVIAHDGLWEDKPQTLLTLFTLLSSINDLHCLILHNICAHYSTLTSWIIRNWKILHKNRPHICHFFSTNVLFGLNFSPHKSA